MKKVAFICVHNSCRSQIAETLGRILCSDSFECYSAGTELKNEINKDAVRIVKDMYGIDMNETQFPKLLSDIPKCDIYISMGCNVQCPVIPGSKNYNWGLDDPSGKEDSFFISTIKQIEEKIKNLKTDITD